MNELRFQPYAWHGCEETTWWECDAGVNCYSYALNNAEHYWSVPGLGYQKTCPKRLFNNFNRYFADYSLTKFYGAMIQGAIRDGLIQTETPQETLNHYPVALFLSNHPSNFDFHWYRKDNDGSWSHKDSWKTPTNTAIDGGPIRDPRANPPSSYPVFGGFFLVPRAGIELTRGPLG